MNAAANAALEQLTKNDPYGQSNQSNATGGYQTSYNPNVSSNKVPSYQPAGQGYQNNTSYNNSQVSWFYFSFKSATLLPENKFAPQTKCKIFSSPRQVAIIHLRQIVTTRIIRIP